MKRKAEEIANLEEILVSERTDKANLRRDIDTTKDQLQEKTERLMDETHQRQKLSARLVTLEAQHQTEMQQAQEANAQHIAKLKTGFEERLAEVSRKSNMNGNQHAEILKNKLNACKVGTTRFTLAFMSLITSHL